MFVILWSGPAAAVGPGLRAGNLVIHPSFKVSAGYDSNYWRESQFETSAPVNPVTVVRFGGGIKLENRNATKAAMSLKLAAFGRYAKAGNPDETISVMDDAARLADADAEFKLKLLPKSPFSVELNALSRYSERPGVEFVKEDGYERFVGKFGPDLVFRPGAGSVNAALEFRLSYRFGMERALSAVSSLGSSRGDRDSHNLGFLAQWKFFPKTALFIDVRYSAINYRRGVDLTSSGQPVDSPNKDLSPLRAELGLRGLVTRRLSLVLRGGYVNSYNDAGASYQGALGRFNLDYVLEPTLRLGLGYVLKLGDDAFSNYYTLNRGFVKATVNMPARLFISGRFGLDYYSYSRDGSPEWDLDMPLRTEPILRAKSEFGWEAVNWLTLSASWEFENNRSDFCYRLGENPGRCFAGDAVDLAAYSRHLVMVTVASEY